MIRRIIQGVVCLSAVAIMAGQVAADGLDDFKRGRAAFERGEGDLAIRHLTRAIESDELPAAAQSLSHYFRGFLLYTNGNYADSLPDLQQAVRLGDFSDDVTASVLTMQGRSHAELGDFGRAFIDLDEAVRLDPASAYAREQRGHVHAMKGNYDAALRDYNELARRYPAVGALYRDRAGVHAMAGDLERALNDYDTAIELTPEDSHAYRFRALAHLELGDLRQARSDHETAARLDPSLAFDPDWVMLAEMLAEATSASE